ncbi:nucleoside monophosphate kinase [Candidatus Microgenomates bacterium]|nr:MAG: nucleoside monophosphate kinase [Candidatus Microgenomates bacterium]
MNIILLGPQGCGKGTQAKKLVAKYGYYYLGMGESLRQLSQDNSELKEILARGELVPDDTVFKLLTDKLREEGVFDNIIFDGYPRSRVQLHAVKDWLEENGKKIDLAILIDISEGETIKRLSSRRTDKTTGEIYNLITNPPPVNVRAENLVQREDDKPEAIRERLAEYRGTTEPVLKDLEKLSILRRVDGEKPIEEIFNEIVKIINEQD